MFAVFRKKLLVNPRFQFTLLGYMLFFSVAVTTVMLISTNYYHQQSMAEGIIFGYEEGDIFFAYLNERYYELVSVVLGSAVICTLILMFGGLYISNRIAGPLLRFKNELYKIGHSGELHEIKFRKKDYFQDVAETFNREMSNFAEKNKGK